MKLETTRPWPYVVPRSRDCYHHVMGSQRKMTVILRNNNTTLSMNQFEIYDNVSGAPVGVVTLKGGESRSIDIAQDADGKGSGKIRDLDLGGDEWVEISAISAGDVITA